MLLCGQGGHQLIRLLRQPAGRLLRQLGEDGGGESGRHHGLRPPDGLQAQRCVLRLLDGAATVDDTVLHRFEIVLIA